MSHKDGRRLQRVSDKSRVSTSCTVPQPLAGGTGRLPGGGDRRVSHGCVFFPSWVLQPSLFLISSSRQLPRQRVAHPDPSLTWGRRWESQFFFQVSFPAWPLTTLLMI